MQRSLFLGTAALFFFATLLGGGGAPAPVMQSLLEAMALFWLLFLLWAHFFVRPLPGDAARPSLFLAAILLLAFLHLIPLPYGLWSSLPGREAAAEAVQLAGLGEPWMPISLIPEGTRLAVLQLLPAIAIFFGTYSIERKDRIALAMVPIATAGISALVAALQFSSPGSPTFYLFPKSVFTIPSGLFANRNFQADFLLLGILLSAFQIRYARGLRDKDRWQVRARLTVCTVAIPLFALMVIATMSRAGLLLLGPILLAAFVIASTSRFRRAAAIGAALVAGAAGLFLFLAPPVVGDFAERFQDTGSRLDAWPDLAHAAATFWPVGSGLGTFEPAFRAAESLDFVVPPYFNHAHNDYFEILIEGGVAGAALVLAFLLFYALRAVRVVFESGRDNYLWLQKAAAIGIAVLLIHSLADYPLRTITLQTLFAFFCAVLFSRPEMERRGHKAARA